MTTSDGYPGLENFVHKKGFTGSKVCQKELPKTWDLPGCRWLPATLDLGGSKASAHNKGFTGL